MPASEMKAARTDIRELQRLLGKKTEENEILQDALEVAPKRRSDLAVAVAAKGRWKVKAIARASAWRARI